VINASLLETATDLPYIRRYFAEEIRAVCDIRTESLVEALASVPREQFLGAGPWMIRGSDYDLRGAQAVPTRDADPRNIYHNVSVAIDFSRQLFNGQPATLASWIDKLELKRDGRVLHIGCATGYYTAILAHMVGQGGHVTAIEIDPNLAQRARENLMPMDWVEVRQGDGTGSLPEFVDAILVNAGVTYPLPVWLNSLADGGRMAVPLTVTMPGMGPSLSRGAVLLTTRKEQEFEARFFSACVIYSFVGGRDESINQRLGEALRKMNFLQVRRLLCTPHDPSPACWLHTDTMCLQC
jgi:protein-L-isoaspartate(D-aspartate) O-methyltransferase